MTTTAILVGGNDLKAPTYFMERLAREVTARVKVPKILSCQFSKIGFSGRQESTERWLGVLAKYLPDSEVAEAHEDEFYEQVAWADVVYLHGGRTQTLLEALPDFARSREAFQGKIVIGSSAGANYLSRAYYSPRSKVFGRGIGLVDVAVLVHFGAQAAEFVPPEGWPSVRAQMHDHGETDVLCIAEGEYVIISTKEEL